MHFGLFMIIDLIREQTRETQPVCLVLDTRLPPPIEGPCTVNCTYRVETQNGFFRLQLSTSATIKIVCQRCLSVFDYCYNNETELAICKNDALCDQLMDRYECIVAEDNLVNLNELLTDEFHLYIPQTHPNTENCNHEMTHYIEKKDTLL